MVYYHKLGALPRHRHTALYDDNGKLLYEELIGEEGFSLDSSLLYHRHVPSALVDAKRWELPDQSLTPNDPLLPIHLNLHDLDFEGEGGDVDAVRHRRLVLGNSDVRLSIRRR